MYQLSVVMLYFIAYSFIGWVYEALYYLLVHRVTSKPNFLRLPLTPIYGVGALAIITLVTPYIDNPLLVFVISLLIAIMIEYVSHWLLEKIFHIQLWNYSYKRFHFQGRVALDAAIAFGVMALILVYGIHPPFSSFVQTLPTTVVTTTAVLAALVFVFDFVNTVATLTRIRLSAVTGSFLEVIESLGQQLELLVTAPERQAEHQRLQRVWVGLLKKHRATVRRLHRSYPGARVGKTARGQSR